MSILQIVPAPVERPPQTHTALSDMPTGLTRDEHRAYVKGYSRGCLTYARKHGGGSVTLVDGKAATAEELATAMRTHEAERQPTAHRAGLSSLRAWLRKYSTPERIAAVELAIKGKAPVKSTTRKATTRKATTTTTEETVTMSKPAARTPRESGTVVAMAGPGTPGLAIDPTKPVRVVKETPAYRTKKVARRELAAAMRARGVAPTGQAWEDAKREAGLA